MPTVIDGAIDEIRVPLQAIADFDAYNALWQTASKASMPNQIAVCGPSMIAVSPQPDAVNPYSCTLDVVRNAPVPASASGAVADAFLVQLGREDLDAVLGYAQHIASFKMGGGDFVGTQDLYRSFLRQAAIYNDRLLGSSVYKKAMFEADHLETERQRKRRESDQVEA